MYILERGNFRGKFFKINATSEKTDQSVIVESRNSFGCLRTHTLFVFSLKIKSMIGPGDTRLPYRCHLPSSTTLTKSSNLPAEEAPRDGSVRTRNESEEQQNTPSKSLTPGYGGISLKVASLITVSMFFSAFFVPDWRGRNGTVGVTVRKGRGWSPRAKRELWWKASVSSPGGRYLPSTLCFFSLWPTRRAP